MVHVLYKVQDGGGDPPPQKDPAIFFRTKVGSEPVREWLTGLPEGERHAIGKDLLRAQCRWPVGMPLCRPLRNGLVGSSDGSADESHSARFCSAFTTGIS
jgi:hypothetical protein